MAAYLKQSRAPRGVPDSLAAFHRSGSLVLTWNATPFPLAVRL